MGRESITGFNDALLKETKRIQTGCSPFYYYREIGFYVSQIIHYLEVFAGEQMRFYLHDDLVSDAGAVFRDVYWFLGVNLYFPFDFGVNYNPSGTPRSKNLHRFLMDPRPLKELVKIVIPRDVQKILHLRLVGLNLMKPPLDIDTREALLEDFREDILVTQDLIQRDLSHWLVVE